MAILSAPGASLARWSAPQAFAVVAAAVVTVRVWALVVSPLDLHFDEAQYWVWSRTPDWGYFSKPPLIAWVIAATTAVFGNGEWAVRLAAPLLHASGAWAVFALARRAYGERAGFWAGTLWLTLPAVWLSSFVISTDAVLLPLWTIALYCFWRLKEKPSFTWAALMGLSLVLGALAKYAIVFFPLCLGLAAVWTPSARRALLCWRGATAALVALAVLAPNLIWNAQHKFETVAHTASNANLGASLFHPSELFEFVCRPSSSS
jgi:4-amino-4-deoxy-L-arabinose transferase-like glycosyltransferase